MLFALHDIVYEYNVFWIVMRYSSWECRYTGSFVP
jgi:hypothetical protein